MYLWTRRECQIMMKAYPDGVQAWGMAFAKEWNLRKDDICEAFGIAPADFEYSLKTRIMGLIN